MRECVDVGSESGDMLKLKQRCLGLLLVASLAACVAPQDSSFDLVEASIADIQSAILRGDTTCREVVAGYIRRIEAYDQSSNIHAITQINPNALVKAEAIDLALSRNDAMPELFCAPLLVKDNFDTHDMVTTGGSIALIDSFPPDDAFMVRRLREAGAIVLAKTNMAERSEEHTSELQSHHDHVCRLLLEKKKTKNTEHNQSDIKKLQARP